MADEDEPFGAVTVRSRCQAIVLYGQVVYTDHAYERMEEWAIAEVDVKNVIRGGVPEGSDFEKGSWRYRIRTPKITVVVAFRSREQVVIVTTWRNT